MCASVRASIECLNQLNVQLTRNRARGPGGGNKGGGAEGTGAESGYMPLHCYSLLNSPRTIPCCIHPSLTPRFQHSLSWSLASSPSPHLIQASTGLMPAPPIPIPPTVGAPTAAVVAAEAVAASGEMQQELKRWIEEHLRDVFDAPM